MSTSLSTYLHPPTRREAILILTLTLSFLLFTFIDLNDDPSNGGGYFRLNIPSTLSSSSSLEHNTTLLERIKLNPGEQLRIGEDGLEYISLVADDDDENEGKGGELIVMDESLNKWTAADGPPRTEIVSHAPGEKKKTKKKPISFL